MEHVNSERKKKVKALYNNKGTIINTAESYTVLILKGKVPSGAGGEHTFALQGRASKEGAALWMDANTAGNSAPCKRSCQLVKVGCKTESGS